MIEFHEPIPKKFPPKARCQPLPVIVGDWSEETIKNLWPCYIGTLKSNNVVVTDENDMKSLHNAGFFGQSAHFDRKKFKRSGQCIKSNKQKKNWDQLVISNSVPNLDECLSEKSSKSLNSSEGGKRKSDSLEGTADSESQAKKARLTDESSPCKTSATSNDDAEKNDERGGMTVDLSDSDEEEGKNEEDREGDSDNEAHEDELNELATVRDLDNFSQDDNMVLSLNFEEAFFLSYGLGCLTVLSETDETLDHAQLFETFSKGDKDFVYKYVTYHHYRSKGWIVKPGIKFGGDFLLYKQGPPYYHASFIIVIDKGNSMSWTTLAGLNRLAGSVNKELIIASVSIPGEITLQNMLSASVTETLYRRWVPTSEVSTPES